MSKPEHVCSAAEYSPPPAAPDATTLSLGQRRAITWPRIDPSVAHAAASTLLAAVVHTTDTVRFIAVARSEAELLRQLAAYVAANASHRLWMADASRVRALLAERDFEGAVRAYFTAPDAPWDVEWLVVEPVHEVSPRTTEKP